MIPDTMQDPTTDPKSLYGALAEVLKARERARAQGVEIPPEAIDQQMRAMTGGKYGYADVKDRLEHRPVTARDMGRQMVQGATLGWGDELGLTDPVANAEFEIRNPILSGVMFGAGALLPSVAGSLGLAAAAPRMAGSMLGRLGLATAQGATEGGLAAAGMAPEGDKAVSGALGAGAGAIAGLGSDFLLEAIRGLRPSVQGARRLEDAVRRSGTPDLSRGTFQQGREAIMETAQRGEATGKPRMLADASAPLMLEGEFAATRAVEVFAPLEQKLWGRQADATGRMLDDLKRAAPFKLESVEATKRAIQQERSAWASSAEGFAGLRARNPRIDVTPLREAMANPVMRDAWKQARDANDITMEGIPPALRGVFGPRGSAPRPGRPASFQDLHNLRQILAHKADAAYGSEGKTFLGPAYKTLRDQIDAVISAQVPEYRAIQARYAQSQGQERAFLSGAAAWTRDADMTQLMADVPPDFLTDFRRGVASALKDQLENTKTNRRAAADLMGASRHTQRKLEAVFGDQDTFRQFMQAVEDEMNMAKGLNTMIGGSRTASRQAMDNTSLVDVAAMAGSVPSNAIPVAVGARLVPSAINRRAAQSMGPELMATGPNEIDKALDNIMRRARPPRGAGAISALAGAEAGYMFSPR